MTVRPRLVRNVPLPWADTYHPTGRRRDRRWVIFGHRRGSTLLFLVKVYNDLRGNPYFYGDELFRDDISE